LQDFTKSFHISIKNNEYKNNNFQFGYIYNGDNMDLITHFLVPYIILAAIKSKNKLAGAFGGISPDFDTIFVAWIGILSPQFFIFSHRGITHSFIFGLITSTIFLYVISRKQINGFISSIIKRDISVEFTKTTIGIAYFGVLIHLFLDFLTTKGIPLFYPFSITRYAAEIYPAVDTIITIVAVIVLLVIYLKVNQKYKNAAMAIFMVILVSFGCIMAYEKSNAINAETLTLNGTYNHVSTYPTQNMFTWDIVKSNAQNSSYIVSEYNTLQNQESNIRTFNTPSIENGSYKSGQNAINVADTLPVVEEFKWNSYYALVNAKYNSGKWKITYYDILNSWTGNNVTVTVP
jgi:inner membrane protein